MAHESRRHGVAGRRGEAVSQKWQTWARDGGGGSGRLCGSSRLGLSSFHRHPESDQAERDGVAHFPCLMGVAPSPLAFWEHSSTALGTAHPGRAPAERVAGWQAGGGRSTAWTPDLRIPRGHAAAWRHPPHRQREPGGSAGPGQGAGCGASAAGSGRGRVAVRGADGQTSERALPARGRAGRGAPPWAGLSLAAGAHILAERAGLWDPRAGASNPASAWARSGQGVRSEVYQARC